ncbi:MAG: hypothetical protein HGB26_06745 [Desulfobulbaceae bacterium]|nr:hypothetical protein [Desulfobulbaceae bacterium]
MSLEGNRVLSFRQIAEEIGVARSTLQYWGKSKRAIDAAPEVVEFFESPIGVAFLHRLVMTVHFVMTQLGPCGIRLVCLFLNLSGLDQFVGASYGSQQKVTTAMEEAIVNYGNEEKERLAGGMEPKEITLCEDENFHQDPCLVGIEPVSNFILLEKYSSDRTAENWTTSLREATKGLNLKVIQSTSDEGKGILRHTREHLGAHHSPDLFHVQHELVKGASLALRNRKKLAQKEVDDATTELNLKQESKESYLTSKRGQGRPPDFDKQIQSAQNKRSEAEKVLETAQHQQDAAKEAIRGIAEDYHPYDLESGEEKTAEEVSASLNKRFSEIEGIAAAANLSENSVKRIQKAKRVMGSMVATITFFYMMVRAKVQALGLTPVQERAMYHNLIPAIYLSCVSRKSGNSGRRNALRQSSERLLAPLWVHNGPFADCTMEEKALIEHVATECAHLFQRSSSCVEGRNGYLSLRHHGLHRISDRKLAALTTVHNFFIQDDQERTPAERFFGAKPKDLFAYLLDCVDLPGRPAQKRKTIGEKQGSFLHAA